MEARNRGGIVIDFLWSHDGGFESAAQMGVARHGRDGQWSAVLIALFLFSRYIRFELSMGEDRDDRVADMLGSVEPSAVCCGAAKRQ